METKIEGIKTISFDLWGTLIKSNPEFKKYRNKLFAKYSKLTSETIQNKIDIIKADIDDNVERYGLSYKALNVFDIIRKECNINITIDKMEIYSGSLFKEHCPLLINECIPEMLKKLSQKYRLIVASNTVLMDGEHLSIALEKLNIIKYFSDFSYSSDIGYSKPHMEFFKDVHMNGKCMREQILHVGDNEITDYYGARNYGMNTVRITDQFTIKDFYKLYA